LEEEEEEEEEKEEEEGKYKTRREKTFQSNHNILT
jgi:hypothetical protein